MAAPTITYTDKTNSVAPTGGTDEWKAGDANEVKTVINNIAELLGGADVETQDLGTFTGATISDNADIKGALQELETAVESGTSAAFTESTDGLALTDGDRIILQPNHSVSLPTAPTTFESIQIVPEDGDWAAIAAGTGAITVHSDCSGGW